MAPFGAEFTIFIKWRYAVEYGTLGFGVFCVQAVLISATVCLTCQILLLIPFSGAVFYSLNFCSLLGCAFLKFASRMQCQSAITSMHNSRTMDVRMQIKRKSLRCPCGQESRLFSLSNFLTLLLRLLSKIPTPWEERDSWVPIRTDTQGCGAGLADTKLSPFNDITLFENSLKTYKLKCLLHKYIV